MHMNEFFLGGRVCQDAEDTKPGDTRIVKFNLAFNRKGMDGRPDTVSYFNIVVFEGKNSSYMADLAAKFKQGDQVAIQAEVKTGKFEAKDGTTKYFTSIICRKIIGVIPKAGQPARDVYNDNSAAYSAAATQTDMQGFDDIPF